MTLHEWTLPSERGRGGEHVTTRHRACGARDATT